MVVDWIFGSQVQFSNYLQDRSRKVASGPPTTTLLVADAVVQPVEPVIPPPPTPTVSPTVTPTTPTPTTPLTRTRADTLSVIPATAAQVNDR